MEVNVRELLRPHLRAFKSYSSARLEYTGADAVFLDANENSLGSASEGGLNRYPDPIQFQVKEKISKVKSIAAEQVFVGNGSDEAIDLLYRAFCEPGVDNVIVCPPTYGMYETSAQLNNIQVREVSLTDDFQLQVDQVLATIDANTKMIFICNPNNPTGNLLDQSDITRLVENFKGIVIVDEAYIDFSPAESWISNLSKYSNVVVLQTLSKAWGMAGIRLGMAFGSKELVQILTAIKPPYNVSSLTQQAALTALGNKPLKEKMVQLILKQRDRLEEALPTFSYVQKIYPTATNFILVKVDDPNRLYQFLIKNNVIVRNRDTTHLCKGCVRITVGSEEENDELLKWMQEFDR